MALFRRRRLVLFIVLFTILVVSVPFFGDERFIPIAFKEQERETSLPSHAELENKAPAKQPVEQVSVKQKPALPTEPELQKLSPCYEKGTIKYDQGVCVCQSNWRGKECSIPPVVASTAHDLEIKRRTDKAFVINGFPFNQEFDMLRARLDELSQVVDVFILIESMYTQAGDVKPLYYQENKHLFTKYQDRILHVPLLEKPDVVKTWENEYFVRDAIGRLGMPLVMEKRKEKGEEMDSQDLIVINDADEIPSAESIEFLREHTGYPSRIGFRYRWSAYGFFWLQLRTTDVLSAATYSFYQNNLQSSTQKLRITPTPEKQTLWLGDPNNGNKNWAGWHCSWCFPVELYPNKLTFALRGDGKRWGDDPEKLDLTYLKKLRETGTWFDGSHDMIMTLPTDRMFAPDHVLQNTEMYGYLLQA